jgi:hypothetical protein
MTDAMYKLTGEVPTNMCDFVKLHAAEFKQRGPAHSRIVTMPESRAPERIEILHERRAIDSELTLRMPRNDNEEVVAR